MRPRTLQRLGLVSLLLASMGTAHTLAFAASPRTLTSKVRDGLAGPARDAFDRGQALFADEDFNGARTQFERAHELSDDPRILYNVAVCDKSLRRYARAITALRRSLDEGGPRLPKAYVQVVRDTIAALSPFVSSLVVSTSPAGATVLIDGEPLSGSSAGTEIPVEVGDHLVVARMANYVESTARVRVVGGEASRVNVTLAPAVSRGKLIVNAPGIARDVKASVLVDSVEVGDAPLETIIEAGVHTVTVRADGFKTSSRRVEVEASNTTEASVTLERQVRTAKLRVRTDEETDVIELDGRHVGRGVFEGDVAPGEHSLRVRRSGVEPRVVEIAVAEGEVRSMSISLERRSGVSPYLWIAGGTLLAAGAVTLAVVLTRSTTFEGNAPGTIDPQIIPASSASLFRSVP